MSKVPKSKPCSKCGIEKPLDDFSIGCRRGNKVYHRPDCKICDAEKSRKYYQEHKTERQEYRRNYCKENRETLLTKGREKYHSDPLRKLKCSLNRIRRETGCSLDKLAEFYTTQLEEQNGCCAICGVHISKLNTRFHIDHDHSKTGIESLRALLCCNCNSGIGNLRDSPILCQKAFQYLKSFC